MDYSLLVGIKRRNFEVLDSLPSTPLTQSAVNSHQQGTAGSPNGQKKVHSAAGWGSNSPVPTLKAVRTMSPGALANLRDADGALHAAVVEGQGTFYIGIIDILQEWNYDKWYERMIKKYVLRKDADGLSAMDPLNYRKRFYQRAVLDVLDGLGLEDADDADIFDRYSLPVIPESERDTVETVVSSAKGRPTASTNGLGGYSSTGNLSSAAKTLQRDSDVDVAPSESSSMSYEVQLRSMTSSNQSRDSLPSATAGTDRRFQVKPMQK
jgi:hypothetical protein